MESESLVRQRPEWHLAEEGCSGPRLLDWVGVSPGGPGQGLGRRGRTALRCDHGITASSPSPYSGVMTEPQSLPGKRFQIFTTKFRVHLIPVLRALSSTELGNVRAKGRNHTLP